MSDRVTDEQAAAWQALCDAATEGPWGIEVVSGVRPGTRRSVVVIHKSALYGIADVQSDRLNDADFIAAARAALPALLGERERLRARAERLERVVEAARNFRDHGTRLTMCGRGPCQQVVEAKDRSDPQAQLFDALAALDAAEKPRE